MKKESNLTRGQVSLVARLLFREFQKHPKLKDAMPSSALLGIRTSPEGVARYIELGNYRKGSFKLKQACKEGMVLPYTGSNPNLGTLQTDAKWNFALSGPDTDLARLFLYVLAFRVGQMSRETVHGLLALTGNKYVRRDDEIFLLD